MLDYQIVEFLCCMHLAEGADFKLGGITLDCAGGQLHVLPVKGVLYVHRGDAVTGHLYGVQPQAHAVTLFTPDHHGAYILDGLELLLYHKVGNLAEFQQGALIGVQGNHKDGHCVGIGLGYGGRIAVAR